LAESGTIAATCARLLDDKKAEDILVLRVEKLTSIADYFVIASGRNPRQLRAMAEDIHDIVDEFHLRFLGAEGTPESGWILVDLGDVIVHLFDVPRRQLYSLEVLWGDAPTTDWKAIAPLKKAGE
jgi:ribosome-associated protein